MGNILVPDGEEILVGLDWPDPLLPSRSDRGRVAVLTQLPVAPIAAEVTQILSQAGYQVDGIQLANGEAAKELTEAKLVYQRLLDFGLERSDTIVGVGGGSVTDVAGFIASTWLRGVEVVHIPTTLLAAVDAAIGGKTAVNFAGKNLIGTFWSPTRVVVNVSALGRPAKGPLGDGWAEIIKAGLIASPDLLTKLDEFSFCSIGEAAEAPPELLGIIEQAIGIKVEVVGRDAREAGLRAILNYGHTVGHAMETLAELSHGQAVAAGILAEGEISRLRFGYNPTQERRLIAKYGFSTPQFCLTPEQVLSQMRRDKKRSGQQHRMVLLKEAGQPELVTVSEKEILRGLEFVGVKKPGKPLD